jgi:hypothetical protein
VTLEGDHQVVGSDGVDAGSSEGLAHDARHHVRRVDGADRLRRPVSRELALRVEGLASRLVKGTKLKDVAARKALWEGGKKAVDASTDPLIRFARLVDPEARAVRKRYEDQVEAPMKKSAELLAKARFAIYGTSAYPDATFTLRLSYGQVKGWQEPGKAIRPFTVMAGTFDRATGRPPYELPPSWPAARAKIKGTTPFNFVTTNDIIGGNSGSPVVDKHGAVVGLIFDGNIHSLGGDYGFDETKNRSVAVHSESIIEALGKIYGADRLVTELRPKGTKLGTKVGAQGESSGAGQPVQAGR